MSAYHYSALTAAGQTKKGVMEADSARQIRNKLRTQGLIPLEVIAVKETKKNPAHKLLKAKRRINLSDLSLLTRQLTTLLAAGIPVEEALQAVAQQTEKKKCKEIMHGIRARVMEGHSLATAMSNFPHAFPELYCATVAAGEQTGHLDVVLTRLADYAEQQQQIKQKIQHALIYPSLMIFISVAIVTFLLAFVVPKIIGVFHSTGQSLPILTQILLQISQVVKNDGLFILIAIALATFLFRYLLRYENYRSFWHRCLLTIPLLGYAIRTINTARYARTFGILSQAGVNVLEAMQIAATLITNLPMQVSIKAASSKVREGSTIHSALQQTGYFSPMSTHLIASGETSGFLEQMLERTANQQEQEVTRLIDTSLTLLEPLIILLMGGLVLFIVLAILLPIFELNQLVG